MPALTVAADQEAAAQAAAELVAQWIKDARAARGQVHVALAGGSTPRRTYERLADCLESWQDVHLWFSDERIVGPDDPESNQALVREALLARASIDAELVHRVPVEQGIRAAAATYAAELRRALPLGEDGTPTLDVALLGLGEDGHTASLFAGDPALSPGLDLCVAVERAPKPPPGRVTMTLTTLCAARRVLFLATGASKRPAVEALLSGPDPAVPASLVAARGSEVVVDAEAAPHGDLERSVPSAARLHHVALETRRTDADACRDFYRLLGFDEVPPPPALHGRARWLEHAGQHLHLMLTERPTVASRGHVALVVEDYVAALEMLRAAGHEPEPATEHWGSPRAFVQDPGGHRVELMAFPPG